MYIMKTYGRKRTYGKKRIYRRRRAPARKANAKIARVVKRILHKQLENKVWISYASNIGLRTATASAVVPSVNLLPNVIQGTGHSQRIGNEIKVVKAFIKGYINLLPYNAVNNPLSTPVMCKMWVVSYKQNNQLDNTALTTFQTFFETNNSSTGFQGNMLDLCLTVNKDAWTVHAQKTIQLGSTYPSSTGPVGTGGYFDNSKMILPYYFDYTKHIKTIKYDDTVNNLSTNRNIWILWQQIYADGSSTSIIPVETHFNIRVEYEDA